MRMPLLSMNAQALLHTPSGRPWGISGRLVWIRVLFAAWLVLCGLGGAVWAGDADLGSGGELSASRLDFLPPSYREQAAQERDQLAFEPPGVAARKQREMLSQARTAFDAKDPERALELCRQALRDSRSNRFDAWLGVSRAAMATKAERWETRQRMRKLASAAAINAYHNADNAGQGATALAILGDSLERRSDWRAAIRAWRASLALQEDAGRRAHLDVLIAEHGFRVIGHEVSSDARDPRICIQFSDMLDQHGAPLSDFVQLEQRDLAIEPEERAICIDGVRHGERYHVLLRGGLPAHDGERLNKPVALDIYVRDRAPSVHFPGRAYVLPRGGGASLPIVSVNTSEIEGKLYRIGDRALGGFAADDDLFETLTEDSARELAERSGELLWEGSLDVRNTLNQDVTSTWPLGELLGDQATQPGIYVLTARSGQRLEQDYQLATQWFLMSDLGLTALSGDDGLHALVRSLNSAAPLADVRLRLLAVNQRVLGEARTDAQGYARFDPGLLRGTGGNRAALLTAEGADGDFGLLDLSGSPFDLTDRGVAGRPAPGPVDVFLTAERGVYRPGETAHFTALARDPRARAITGLPLTFIVKRPDGVEFLRRQAADLGLGAHQMDLALLPDAMRGSWETAVYLDTNQPALARTRFLVEDFEPERLEFDLSSDLRAIDPRDPPVLDINARYLFGAPAANLAVEGQARLSPTDQLAALPRFHFGLVTDESPPSLEIFRGAETDASGRARLPVQLPDLAVDTRLLNAQVSVRVIEGSGRPVERDLILPVLDDRSRLGLKPLFDGAVAEGGKAAFEVIAVDGSGKPVAAEQVDWTLSRVRTHFQWYQSDGQWKFEPIHERRRVASGRLDLAADAPGRIESPVEWGAYELEVRGAAGLVPASLAFDAGWYVTAKSYDTPDALKVVLDRPGYRVGDTARVHLEPRFPGLALVMVLNQGIVAMQPVAVTEEGADLSLPVTADWGSGAYVTAALYRPLDLASKRMPRRALGLQWGAVDPGARRLTLELDAPDRVEPRGPLQIDALIADLAPGDAAYVTIAAVDEGILNLTDFKTPAPDNWYFSQQRLGFDIRDLYGRLIDPMQGEAGRLRTGGDAGALMRVTGPPPSEALLALYSGVLAADEQGHAQASFDLPDFNGRARLMAMAWTENGVGHAQAETLIRDPVVASVSMPRFLAPGDESRLLVELTHAEGPAGPVRLALSTQGEALALGGQTTAELNLAPKGRAVVEFPLLAVTPGDGAIELLLETPAGKTLTKWLRLQVRDLTPPVQVAEQRQLEPGGAGFELGAGLLGQSAQQALQPGSESWQVAVTGAGSLDIVGLLQALDRYPYGCSEQLTSRALPMLYVNPLALGVDLDADATVDKRIQETLRELTGKQGSDGSFGLWSPNDGGDRDQSLWLDAYVTDFLTRAAGQGYPPPKTVFALALDQLKNRLSYSQDFSNGGEGIAYALYVLARNGRISLGEVRYYFETKLDAFATPMARAQLGAALAQLGEQPRARQAFKSAYQLWQDTTSAADSGHWRADFGSRLRDGAALLALGAEHLPDALPLGELAAQVNAQASARADGAVRTSLSTQEQAWLVLAAWAQMTGETEPRLEVNGVVRSGPWNGRFDAVDLATSPVRIRNLGSRPQTALITLTGQPRTPPPAGGRGYRISRSYYDLAGQPVNPNRVSQGARLVAVIDVTADRRHRARLMIEDPLPAGFEIDNPHLLGSGDLRALPALAGKMKPIEEPAYQAFLADRMVAAVERDEGDPEGFRLAYAVRAVSPGTFAHPQARVEEMYRPPARGWTDAGTVTITAAP